MHANKANRPSRTSDEDIEPQTLDKEMAAVGIDLEALRYGNSDGEELAVERLLTGESIPRRRQPPASERDLATKWGVSGFDTAASGGLKTRNSYSQAVKGKTVTFGDQQNPRTRERAAKPAEGSAPVAAPPRNERPSEDSAALFSDTDSASTTTSSVSDTDEFGNEDTKEWRRARYKASPIPVIKTNLSYAKYFPKWFDIKQEDKEEDDEPRDTIWGINTMIPMLPNFDPVDYSLFQEVLTKIKQETFETFESWSDSEAEEAYQLQEAIESSRTTYLAEQGRTRGEGSSKGTSQIHVGALIVEVESEIEGPPKAGPSLKESEPSASRAGRDKKKPKKKRFTKEEKGKSVPRDEEQRSFLKRFASCQPEEPKKAPKVRRADPKPSIRKSASSFKRERSQMPDGVFFNSARRKHAPVDSSDDENDSPPSSPPTSDHPSPPSSSSSSSSSEDDSDGESSNSSTSSDDSDSGKDKKRKKDSEKEKKKKYLKEKRRLKKVLSGVKIKPPFVWQGKPDLEIFDQWVYDVDTWLELNGIDDKLALRVVKPFMSGQAAKFFMKHVATEVHKWTMKKLYAALFNYCFPTDFKEMLREQLMGAQQGTSKVRDFIRDLETLAARFADITDMQLTQIFWGGIHQYLRLYLIEKGKNPEVTKLSTLVKYATRKENAMEAKRREEKAFTGRHGRTWGRFQSRTTGPESIKPAEQQNNGQKGNNPSKSSTETKEKTHQNRPKEQKPPRPNKLSKEERDRLRAEGKCFNCKETGHESRNCPKRKTAKAPTIQAGSIRFNNIEKLAKKARDTEVGVASAQFDPEHLETDTERSDNESESCFGPYLEDNDIKYAEVIRALIQEEGNWSDNEMDDRFQIIDLGDRLEVIDWEDSPRESYIVTKEEIRNESFDINEALTHLDSSEHQEDDTWVPRTASWLHMRTAALLEGAEPDARVQVDNVPGGYQVTILEEGISFWVSENELNERTFEIGTKLEQVRDENQVLDSEEDADAYQDRRRRHLKQSRQRRKVMLGAVTPKRPKRAAMIGDPDNTVNALERNAMRTRDLNRKIPKTIVITIHINGKPIRALVDSGSMADFLSTTIVDQLQLKREILIKPLPVQLAVHGSRTKVNCCTTVDLEYQGIKGQRRFDIANLDHYDAILGTPFLFQHKVAIAFNPSRIVIGSTEPEAIKGVETSVIVSAAVEILEDELEKLRAELRREAADLCADADHTELPPLRIVNHRIPLIDDRKVYPYRPAKCPDALKPLWQTKKDRYLASGRWRIATGRNAIPILLIPKPPREDGQLRLRATFDKRPQNKNTYKLASPLPDIDTILRNVARHVYWTGLDGNEAYEQIRIEPEDIWKTLFTTPDGTMESLVLQQGDCNGPATYQTLMNQIFAPYIGVFMDVYLDDIIIYSDTIEDHMKHFFARKLKILGHVIDKEGIAMDPHKVDKIANWKVPTNKSLLSSFLGAVGFLAPDCQGIRIPMAVLTPITGSTSIWRWTETHQRAFEEIKSIVQKFRDHRRTTLDYSKGAPKINLVTDASMTGASGYISQGDDLKTAKIITFWSGKFNSAQQNYPVHEQELLAIVESLKRFRQLLHGAKFYISTDHKGLEHIKTQKHLSPRQHRWVDVLNEFNYEINYIPGETNVLADALSRIYSDEPIGTVRARSEYVQDDNSDDEDLPELDDEDSMPIYTGSAAIIELEQRRSSRLAEKPHKSWAKPKRQRKPRNEVPKAVDTKIAPEPTKTNQPTHANNEESENGIVKPYGDKQTPQGNPRKKETSQRNGNRAGTLDFGSPRNQKDTRIPQRGGVVEINGGGHNGVLQILWDVRDEQIQYTAADGAVENPAGTPTPWQYIGIDFVGPLPASTNRLGSFDMICVVIDLLTSMVHLTPTVQTYGASQMAEVIFENVYKLHGLPERIISDRDTLFTSTFWKRLHELLRTELRLSSSYHPQTDGATERANRTMTQMLRQCVRPDQKDWVQKLPAIELAMNTARSDTTGFSPFFLNYGRMPRSLIWEGDSKYPGVQEFAMRMKEAIMSAHDAIISARVQQTKYANKRRRDAPFKEGDLAYLSTKNLKPPKGRARKLVPKYLGPFRISKVIEPGATYKLELPKELKARGINDAFHASLLRPHIPNDDRRFPGRQPHQLPGFGEQPKEWIVDRIVSHSGKGTEAEFEVQWSTGDVTWVPYHDVKHLQAFEEYCEALGIQKIGQLGAKKDKKQPQPTPQMSAGSIRLELPKIRGPKDQDVNRRAYRSSIKELRGEGEPSTTKDSPILSLPNLSAAQYLSPLSMAETVEFYAQDHAVCMKHAKLLNAWLAGNGPYPGNPPRGYTDVFVKKNPLAPNPKDFAEKIEKELAKETAKPQEAKSDGEFEGVKMSTVAFTAFLQSNKQAAAQVIEVIKMIQPAQQRIIQPPPRQFNPNPRGGGRGHGLDRKSHDHPRRNETLTDLRTFPERIQPRNPPPIRFQPNGLPVPLGRGKSYRRGKRGGRGKAQGEYSHMITPETLLTERTSATVANEVDTPNQAGPSNQASPSTQEEDVPMGGMEQGSTSTAQHYPETEQYEEPHYEGHDPLTFGMEGTDAF
ncbi:hypothetical protein NLI96_g3480 [Meripilus lineatus]|uniref:RNA-directed DNA polymerase n=1 Tax=Meripilus lineatus TaxID=2056292 RepID=A0AAD5VC52_9APHY|nr:hypothetical protein NLI96_g3480 [Physisporinus lineatus]